MATSSPGQSIHPKSPRSPRKLPVPPCLQQMPIAREQSPNQSETRTVFEFPPRHYPETPVTNFGFDEFGRANEEQQRGARNSGYYHRATPRSPKTPNSEMQYSPDRKSPIFHFCHPCKNLKQNANYPAPATSSMLDRNTSVNPSGYSRGNPKPYDRRRNTCSGLTNVKNCMSPTIVTSSTHEATSPKLNINTKMDSEDTCRETGVYKSSDTSKTSSVEGVQEKIVDGIGDRTKSVKMDRHFNKSQGCLDEAGRSYREGSDKRSRHRKGEKNMSRRSTSDLTDMSDVETEVTLLSSPRKRCSMKGGLAYLASRRSSRDSQCSNTSNVTKDIGPSTFNANPRARQRRTSNFLELPVPDHIKPRVHSLPEKAYNPRDSDDLYRLRAFSITHKGVVNRGDSIISRRSRSNTSVNSSRNSNVSERSPFDGSCCSGQGTSTESDIEDIPKYRVVMLGDSGVGKTALVSQFMTSEYMNTYDASLDDEFGEKTVSILLDNEESEIVFIDHPHVEMSVENSLSTYEPHACVVVYSIVSRTSFQVTEEILNYLWGEHYTQERSVIVVGNKSDLARSRIISTNEGKLLATSRECKFIETSSGIQHNVDELLVGVLKQIRLREARDKKLRHQNSKGKGTTLFSNSKTILNLNLAKEILNKVCLNDNKSKSCENLHVL